MSSSQEPSKSTKWLKKLFKSKSDQLPANSSCTAAPSNPSDRPLSSTVMENVKISARFAQSILPNLGGCVDGNPVKVVFGILSLIIKVRKVSAVPARNSYGRQCANFKFFLPRISMTTRMYSKEFSKRPRSFLTLYSKKWRWNQIRKVSLIRK